MERLEKDLECVIRELKYLTSEIQHLVASKHVCQLYIQMKKRKNRISSLDRNLREKEESIDIQMLEFETNDYIKDVFKTDGIGKLVTERGRSKTINTTQAADIRDVRDITATHVSNFDFGTDIDTGFCCQASSFAFLSDNNILVTDCFNFKVKLFDIERKWRIAEHKLKGCPHDITIINENQAVVSISGIWTCHRRLVLLNVGNTFNVEREIVVSDDCHGVAYYQNQLFVTYKDNPGVDIMDMQGNVLQTIKTSTNGDNIFTKPLYVSASSESDIIYVADQGAKKVFCVTTDGEVKHEYDKLQDPQKMCTDQFGHIYVAGSNSKTVHVIAADLSDSKAILSEKDGLNSAVTSIGYCQNTNRLYVGLNSQGTLKVFKLT